MKKKHDFKLIQTKPYKKYKISISNLKHVKEFLSLISSNKDKKISFVINGLHTAFTSLATQKKFATGFEQGFNAASQHSKELFANMQQEINDLKSVLGQTKKQIEEEHQNYSSTLEKFRRSRIVADLRVAAYKDALSEVNEDRELLNDRLKKGEPIIKAIKEAKTDGQLQTVYMIAKKNKV